MTPEELLKEVGEPFAYYDPDLGCGSSGISFDPLSDGIYLYTSDQVSAAVLKVTGPLGNEVDRLLDRLLSELDAHKVTANRSIAAEQEHHKTLLEINTKVDDLRAKLAAAQEEMNDWRNQAHQSQSAFDRLQDQLAKAEQRVAEAIVDMLQQKHRNCFGAHSFYLAASVATANGEWRKFVKEM